MSCAAVSPARPNAPCREMTRPPDLTVVVVPLLGGDDLGACLDLLPLGGVECIVVLRGDMAAQGTALARRYPAVRFLDAGDRPVPLRRRLGVEAARGDLVALLEDTTRPGPGWCDAVSAAFADPRTGAAGGPVRIAETLPNRFQALGWSEYGAFEARRFARLAAAHGERRPGGGGPFDVARLPGNNMAFRRAALLEVLGGGGRGLVEGEAFAALRARGLRLVCHPGMSATYAAPDHHGAALGARLRHGRLYAAARAEGRGWARRLALAAKAPLLPAVLSARALSAMAGTVRPAAFAPVALWVGLMEGAWALGEAVGAVAGPGRSLEAWR